MLKLSAFLKLAGLALAVIIPIEWKHTETAHSDGQLLAGRYHQRSHSATSLGRSSGVRSNRNTYQHHWDHVRPGTQPGRRAPEMIATKPEVGTRS